MTKSREEKIQEAVNNADFVCESVDDLNKLQKLQDFLSDQSLHYVFRGVSDCTYDLLTTLYRHVNEFGTIYEQQRRNTEAYKQQYSSLDKGNFYISITLKLLDFFASGLIRIGENSLQEYTDYPLLDMFEIARHYGIPMPLLDFTYSFDIALFFAFNNLKLSNVKKDYVKIYALNTIYVDSIWDKFEDTFGKKMLKRKI